MTQASRSFSAEAILYPREFGTMAAGNGGWSNVVANGSAGGALGAGRGGIESVSSEQAGIATVGITSSRSKGMPKRSLDVSRSSTPISRSIPSLSLPTSIISASISGIPSSIIASTAPRSTTSLPMPISTVSPVFGGQRSLFSDPTIIGILATTSFGVLIAAILLLAFRRRSSSPRKSDSPTKPPSLFTRFPDGLGSPSNTLQPTWMTNQDLKLRAIGFAGIITIIVGGPGLFLLPLAIAGVPSLPRSFSPSSSILSRGFKSLVANSPFFFSTLDDLTLYRLFRAHDLRIPLSPSPFLRLTIITVVALVLSNLVAIGISREITRVQGYVDRWTDSVAGGWEVGWLSLKDEIWKRSPAPDARRGKFWNRFVEKEQSADDSPMQMTEGRLRRIFYACGLGARQAVESTVQEVFVENVFAIPDLTALNRLEEQRRSTIVALEITSAKFVACFEQAEISLPRTHSRTTLATSGQRLQPTIVPHAPLAHYRLASRLSLSSLSAALPPPRSAPSTPPPPTPPSKGPTKLANNSSFTEIGLTQSREDWGVGDELRFSERGRGSRLYPAPLTPNPIDTSPFSRSIYQVDSRPSSAEPLSKSFLDRESDVERFSIDEEDESTFQLARTVDGSVANSQLPTRRDARRSIWPMSSPLRTDESEAGRHSESAVESNRPAFYPRIVPIAGVSPDLIEELSSTKRTHLSRLRRLNSEIEILQKTTREESKAGRGTEGFIVVGRNVCSIPGVRRIEGTSNDDIIWEKLCRRSTFTSRIARSGALVLAMLLTGLALLVPTFLSLCATADVSTRWNVSDGIARLTGLPLGLLVTLIPALMTISLGGSILILVRYCTASSSAISITESRRQSLDLTMWNFMLGSLWIMGCSTVIWSRLDPSNPFDGILLLSPLFLAVSILLALVVPAWSLGGVEGSTTLRKLRNASSPRERFQARYHPRDPSRPLYIVTIVLVLLLSTSFLIPLVAIPLTLCIGFYLLVERRTTVDTDDANPAASVFYLTFLKNLLTFSSIPSLLLALLLLHRRILSLGIASLATALLVLSLRARQFSVDWKRNSRDRFSVFTKHSLNGFRVGAGDGSFLEGNNQPHSSVTTASLIPRRSLASIFEMIDSFSSSNGSVDSSSSTRSNALDRPSPLPRPDERIDAFLDIDRAASLFHDESAAPRVTLRSASARKRDYYPPVLSAKGVVWLPLGEEEEASEMGKWGIDVVCA